MHDEWVDRLSEYLDGELSVREQAALEEHLVTCDVCRVTLAELRAVIDAARAVDNPPPARDLWPAIAAAIAAPPAGGAAPRAGRTGHRRISFTVPQLAAAAVVLMALSGGAVWYLSAAGRSPATVAGTLVQSASSAPTEAVLVATAPAPDPTFEATVAQLEQTLEQRRAELDPATVDVLERSLETIDRAIEDARAALGTDPGNPYLRNQLESTMQRKLDVLRRASAIQRGT